MSLITCPTCRGLGEVARPLLITQSPENLVTEPCLDCSGEGQTEGAFVDSLPDCDFCRGTINDPTPAHFDARVFRGGWANLCDYHFEEFGIGLGTGRGQHLFTRELVSA